MIATDALLQRYVRACEAVVWDSSANGPQWPIADTKEFAVLRDLFMPLAESGHVHCQYALATIHLMGFCYEEGEDFVLEYEATMQTATHWLIAAASQGHWFALDSVITSGVGPEADRLREVSKQFEREHPELIGWYPEMNMPIYGWDFMQELCKTVYGHVIDM